MEKSSPKFIFDGKLIDIDRTLVPATSRGLMYGDGIFETFRTYGGRLFLLDEHLIRLHEGLEVLGISPPRDIEKKAIKPLIREVLEANGLKRKDAILRLQVWRDGRRGYMPQRNAKAHFMITASECSEKFTFPSLATVDRRRIPSEALPSRYKFTNGINYILAAREASARKADDALMQNISDFISETTMANIFWLKNSTVFTPSEECDLLPGITRQVCIDLLQQDQKVDIQTGEFELNHVLEADIVWICNSVRELLPVRRINKTEYSTEHELLLRLRKTFTEYRNDHLQKLD